MNEKVPYVHQGMIDVYDMDGKKLCAGVLQHVGPGYYMVSLHPDGAGTEMCRVPYPHKVQIQDKLYVVEAFDGDPEADYNPFGFFT